MAAAVDLSLYSENERGDQLVEAIGRAESRYATARNADGSRMFPALVEDAARRERWKWLIESVEDTGGGFDYSMNDEDLAVLPRENWRRPSWRRRNLEVIAENQWNRIQAVRRNPRLLATGGERGVLVEDTTSSPDVVAFTTETMSLIRRMWPLAFFQDIVPTFSISQPTLKLHFVDYTFATAGQTYAVGQRIDNNEDPDYTDDPGECTAVNEIDAAITEKDVSAETLKALSTLSLEAQQDANAYYAFDLGAGLTDTHARLLARNTNRKVIEDLRTLGSATSASFDKTTPAGAPYDAIDPKIYGAQIYDAILDVDNSIGSGTFLKSDVLVGDPSTTVFMEKLNSFQLDPIGDMRGRSRVDTTPNLRGTLRGRWDFYEDWFLVTDQIIVGARGPSFSEAGYAYFPYIDAFSLPPFLDPRDQCIHRGMMSRFARDMYKPEYFGRVNVSES